MATRRRPSRRTASRSAGATAASQRSAPLPPRAGGELTTAGGAGRAEVCDRRETGATSGSETRAPSTAVMSRRTTARRGPLLGTRGAAGRAGAGERAATGNGAGATGTVAVETGTVAVETGTVAVETGTVAVETGTARGRQARARQARARSPGSAVVLSAAPVTLPRRQSERPGSRARRSGSAEPPPAPPASSPPEEKASRLRLHAVDAGRSQETPPRAWAWATSTPTPRAPPRARAPPQGCPTSRRAQSRSRPNPTPSPPSGRSRPGSAQKRASAPAPDWHRYWHHRDWGGSRGRLRRIDDDGARARVGGPGRKEGRRIDVSLVVVRMPDSELDIGAAHLRVAARTDRPDAVALGDRRATRHTDRSELGEGHRPAVRREDRDRLPVPRHGAGERDRAGRRRPNHLSGSSADVDAPMLPSSVGMGGIERVGEQNRSARGPRPGRSRTCESERYEEDEQESTHEVPPLERDCCRIWRNACQLVVKLANRVSTTVENGSDVVNTGYSIVTNSSGTARSARRR